MRRSKLHIVKIMLMFLFVGILINLLIFVMTRSSKWVPTNAQISNQHIFQPKVVPSGGDKSNSASSSVDQLVMVMSRQISYLEGQLKSAEVHSFLSRPVINKYNFSYIHNPLQDCLNREIKTLLVVQSPAINVNKRQKMRSGDIGIFARNKTNNVKLLFFLGMPTQGKYSKKHQLQIKAEAENFGDIVQQSFEDNYINIKFKSVTMLQWANMFCTRAKYVIRSDDDISFSVATLESVMSQRSETMTNFVICRKRVVQPPDPRLKHTQNIHEETQIQNASNHLGGLQGYPLSTAKLLYEATLRMNPILLESAYIAEACAEKVHVPVLTDPAFDFQLK